jgi:hypothetical protein
MISCRHTQLGEAAYRRHPFVSNSALSAMKSGYLNLAAFRTGTLAHSTILELPKVNAYTGKIEGQEYTYSIDEIDLAMDMRRAFYKSQFCADLVQCSEVEVEMYNANTQFDGIALDTKRKYDIWSYTLGWGGDLKSTTARSEAEFLHHIDQFDYDRARVFYAKGSGAKKDVIIGISKHKPHPLYIVTMQEGDPIWTRGLAKCNAITKLYHELNPPF